jgi:hypothetical protein
MGAERSVRERHAAEMRRVVGGFEQSGLTQAAYCRMRGVSLRQFHYWREMPAPATFRRQSSFVELEVVRDAEASGEIELRLPGGVTAVVRAGTKASLIRRLLRAAKSC